jgi:two-component system LytT family sensor kinase
MMMKKIFNRIFRILTSRLALNLFVWLLLLDTLFNNNKAEAAPTHNPFYIMSIIGMQLILFALIYVNTSLLIPLLLLRKKYGKYVLAVLLHAILFSGIIGWYSEWLIKVFPGTQKYYYTVFSIPSKDAMGIWDYYTNVFLSTVITTLILFSLGRLMQFYFKEKRRSELLEKKQLESELMLLKSQINPHFLFNVLNSIYSLSLKKSDKAPEVILKLSDILRYMLYESRQDYVPVDKELQMLKDYIDIEKIRLTEKEAITLNIEKENNKGYIAPAMLISFIENAVKHGLDSRMKNAFVEVTVKIDEASDMLHFYCRNNYLPRMNNALHTNIVGGIGLENVRKRLELIYPGNHSLMIINENNIFEVNLTLKLKTHDLPHNR